MLNFLANSVKWSVTLTSMLEICSDLLVIVALTLKELKHFAYCKNIFMKCSSNLSYVTFAIANLYNTAYVIEWKLDLLLVYIDVWNVHFKLLMQKSFWRFNYHYVLTAGTLRV